MKINQINKAKTINAIVAILLTITNAPQMVFAVDPIGNGQPSNQATVPAVGQTPITTALTPNLNAPVSPLSNPPVIVAQLPEGTTAALSNPNVRIRVLRGSNQEDTVEIYAPVSGGFRKYEVVKGPNQVRYVDVSPGEGRYVAVGYEAIQKGGEVYDLQNPGEKVTLSGGRIEKGLFQGDYYIADTYSFNAETVQLSTFKRILFATPATQVIVSPNGNFTVKDERAVGGLTVPRSPIAFALISFSLDEVPRPDDGLVVTNNGIAYVTNDLKIRYIAFSDLIGSSSLQKREIVLPPYIVPSSVNLRISENGNEFLVDIRNASGALWTINQANLGTRAVVEPVFPVPQINVILSGSPVSNPVGNPVGNPVSNPVVIPQLALVGGAPFYVTSNADDALAFLNNFGFSKFTLNELNALKKTATGEEGGGGFLITIDGDKAAVVFNGVIVTYEGVTCIPGYCYPYGPRNTYYANAAIATSKTQIAKTVFPIVAVSQGIVERPDLPRIAFTVDGNLFVQGLQQRYVYSLQGTLIGYVQNFFEVVRPAPAPTGNETTNNQVVLIARSAINIPAGNGAIGTAYSYIFQAGLSQLFRQSFSNFIYIPGQIEGTVQLKVLAIDGKIAVAVTAQTANGFVSKAILWDSVNSTPVAVQLPAGEKIEEVGLTISNQFIIRSSSGLARVYGNQGRLFQYASNTVYLPTDLVPVAQYVTSARVENNPNHGRLLVVEAAKDGINYAVFYRIAPNGSYTRIQMWEFQRRANGTFIYRIVTNYINGRIQRFRETYNAKGNLVSTIRL